jgi:hypothetical protein
LPIVPDDKDWTWVLERRCPECEFDASSLARADIATLIRSNAEAWAVILGASSEHLRQRASDDRWSPLEYACHVRDVFGLYGHRLQLMLAENNPTFPNWDQDQSAEDDRYNEQDPAVVASDLGLNAEALASAFEGMEGDDWDRLGARSDGAHFSVDTFGRYMIHDPIHHLHDVRVDLVPFTQ